MRNLTFSNGFNVEVTQADSGAYSFSITYRGETVNDLGEGYEVYGDEALISMLDYIATSYIEECPNVDDDGNYIKVERVH